MQEFLDNVTREIIDPAITLLVLAAFVVFLWGMVEFIRNGDSDEKRITGQRHMVWGVIGLVIVFGAKALVEIIKNTVS
jgi:uncharacterized membrane protein